MFKLEKVFQNDDSAYILFATIVKTLVIVLSYYIFSVLEKENLETIDFLKVDTEGHELEVLLGLGKEIQIIQIIFIEFHNDNIYLNYSNNKIHNYLLKRNFFLQKKIKFPFTEWEDRIYINDN